MRRMSIWEMLEASRSRVSRLTKYVFCFHEVCQRFNPEKAILDGAELHVKFARLEVSARQKDT